MKKSVIIKLSLFLLFFIVLPSCQYGFHEVFGREDEANQRSFSVKILDDTEFDPKVSDEKFSVLFVTDVHFGKGERREEDFFKKTIGNKITGK